MIEFKKFDPMSLLQLTQVELKDYPDDDHAFELVDKVGGQSLILKIHRNVKEFWLKEIREFATDYGESIFITNKTNSKKSIEFKFDIL